GDRGLSCSWIRFTDRGQLGLQVRDPQLEAGTFFFEYGESRFSCGQLSQEFLTATITHAYVPAP
ncbi:MAG: hypothetical protein ABIF77_19410, partial [bacterium]